MEPTPKNPFKDFGYVVLKQAVPTRLMDELRLMLCQLLRSQMMPGEDLLSALNRLYKSDPQLLYRLYLLSHNTMAMNRAREFMSEIAIGLIGRDKVLIDVASHVVFGMPEDEKLIWNWHQDSNYDPESDTGINICFPFVAPATKNNGTMSLLKGSHKLGVLPYDKIKIDATSATSLVPKNIEKLKDDYEEVYFEAELGDLIAFDRNLIHRSNRNTSSLPRLTTIIQFIALDRVPASLEKRY